MRSKAEFFRLSASDISNHLACKHLTELNRAVAEGRLEAPKWRDPMLAILHKRGLVHEEEYVEHLRASGLQVVQPAEGSIGLSTQRTLAAMHIGADVIFQAELQNGRWVDHSLGKHLIVLLMKEVRRKFLMVQRKIENVRTIV